MAEEEKKADEKKDEAKEKKKGLSKVLILVGLIVLLGGGGFGGWYFFLKKAPADGRSKVAEAAANPVVPGIMHEMDSFIVNLLGQQGRRYLKTKIDLEVENEKMRAEIAERMPQLRDAILLVLTSKSFDDVNSLEGKIQLRNELIARINQILKTGAIKGLYFTEFVVQ